MFDSGPFFFLFFFFFFFLTPEVWTLLIMLVDVCQCCRLLMFACSSLFKTLSLSLNLVNKTSESEVGLVPLQVEKEIYEAFLIRWSSFCASVCTLPRTRKWQCFNLTFAQTAVLRRDARSCWVRVNSFVLRRTRVGDGGLAAAGVHTALILQVRKITIRENFCRPVFGLQG